jgi:flagellar basal body-associated protein FliL
MDENAQADEARKTLKVFCISALVILAGSLCLVFLFGGGNNLKAQAQTPVFLETQK